MSFGIVSPFRWRRSASGSIVFPEVEDIEAVCYPLAVEEFTAPDYRMPKLQYHDKSKLEAALGAVKNSYYTTLPHLAAALIYYLIKNHPFRDGNKRMGVISLYAFLASNGYIAKQAVDKDKTVAIAEKIAMSEAAKKDEIIEEVAGWIQENYLRV